MFYYVFILSWHSLILQLPRANIQSCLQKSCVLEAFCVSLPLSFSFVYIDFHHKFMWKRW